MRRTVLLAAPLLVLLGACSSSPDGEDLVGPFEDGAEQAYEDQGVDRSDTTNLSRGVQVEDCWVVDADGVQAIGEAAYGDGDYAVETTGALFGQVGQEQLSCPIGRDGEPGLGFSVATTDRSLDDLAALREEAGYEVVETPDTDLDEDAVLLTGNDEGTAAVWLDGGLLVGVGGRDLDAEAAVGALEAAVDAVSEHLGD
ncbi:hypothetical protein GCM10023340_12810 [Nocardioides marinquilinus]|uniref:DUF3558 domain-containing protein n=1 Tax=Nocardioides marinquilinus TaxID=1210400 RepID=A0ABP9PF73_9ACTN